MEAEHCARRERGLRGGPGFPRASVGAGPGHGVSAAPYSRLWLGWLPSGGAQPLLGLPLSLLSTELPERGWPLASVQRPVTTA